MIISDLGYLFVAKVIDIQNDERRRDRRRPVLLSGRLDGSPVKIIDVSMGGVRCAIELEGEEDISHESDTDLTLEIDGRSGDTHSFTVRVTWVNERSGTLGAAFGSLSDRQFLVLEKVMLGRPI